MKRIVLVTGGSKGIGKAIVTAFAEADDAVVINYSKSKNEAEALKVELSQRNDSISIEKADVANYAQVKEMINNVIEKHGRIDVLVNNAGITRDSFLMLMSERDWNDVIDINLTGVFNCSKAVSEYMISQRGGVIINIASLSGMARSRR